MTVSATPHCRIPGILHTVLEIVAGQIGRIAQAGLLDGPVPGGIVGDLAGEGQSLLAEQRSAPLVARPLKFIESQVRERLNIPQTSGLIAPIVA